MTELADRPAEVETVHAAGSPLGRRKHRIALAAIATASAGLNAAAGFLQYRTFRAGTFDLVIFDQAIRSYSRFRLPISIAKGVHNGFGAGFVILGDHFSPILALLAPLYWLSSGPQTLIIAQAVLFAVAVFPLFSFTRRELGPVCGYGIVLAYAVSWPVAQAVTFDFHEVAFAPVLTALLFDRWSAYRHGAGRWWPVAVAALLLLTVKDDTGLLIAGFGLAVLVQSLRRVPARRVARWLGSAFVLGGLAAVLVATRFVLPAFGGRAFGGRAGFYGAYGQTMFGALVHIAAHPVDAIRTFVQPAVKADTMLRLFGLAVFAPFASPYLLAVLPMLAERMLADAPNWWGTEFHYNAYLVVPLLCAGVDGIARIQRCAAARSSGRPVLRWSGRLGALWTAAVLIVGVCSIGSFGFGPVLRPSSWQRTPAMTAEAAAVAVVPSGVTVEAANNLGPQLSGRTTVLLWDRLPRWAPWVVADVHAAEFPFCDLAEQRTRVDYLEQHGYRAVFSQEGFLVLHDPAALPPLDTAPSPSC
ncbi:MAG TPA: DUF2079 domain-containing protein [Pseudonocardiaceae bacterium]|jgi:uncharacterized membrane protein|nr:DUF2079 domain-containing protein [Pseudonocardiaceae bacterium]